jgi:hypothetical protein
MNDGYVAESITVQTVMEHRELSHDVSAPRIAHQLPMTGKHTGDEKYGLLQQKETINESSTGKTNQAASDFGISAHYADKSSTNWSME